METSHADRVREYARREYIEPARARHQSMISVVAGDVHRGVRLANRVPLVCRALKSHKVLTENHLRLERLEGPPSGMGTRVTFTYRILDGSQQASAQPEDWPFRKLRGVAREVFRSLGGGETFLRIEREEFHGPEKSS